MENPRIGKTMNAPTSETGTASNGISVARQPCRKMKTTRMTSASASNSVFLISWIPAVMASVVSRGTLYVRSCGNLAFGFLHELADFAGGL